MILGHSELPPMRFYLNLSICRALAFRGDCLQAMDENEIWHGRRVPAGGWRDTFNDVVYRPGDLEQVRLAMAACNWIVPIP